MATKLRFQRGTSRSFLLTFLQPDDEPEDLTEATFAAYIKYSVFDADEDALVDISARLEVYDAALGKALLHFFPEDTAELDPFAPIEWEVRAIVADGRVLSDCDKQGPLVFCPCLGPSDVPEADATSTIEPIANMSSFIEILTAITGLTGGSATDLDGLSAVKLASKPNRAQVELDLGNGISVRYRIEDRAGRTAVSPANGGFRIFCLNDTNRLWNLVLVAKEGVPCVWNADTVKWHQQLASGTGAAVAPALAQEADAFSLPA